VLDCKTPRTRTTRTDPADQLCWTARHDPADHDPAELLRGYLYEAATVLLTRLQRASALRSWGRALAERIGIKEARVAVARKLALLLHRLWTREEDFRWTAA
jgi:transposase